MNTITVYVDVLLFVNLAVNGFIIYTTSRLTGTRITFSRFAAGDISASLYGLAICIPQLELALTLLLKTVFSAVVCLICFGCRNKTNFFKKLCIYNAVSVTYLCVVLACGMIVDRNYLYVRNGEIYFNVPVPVILSVTLVMFLILGVIRRIWASRTPENLVFDCIVSVGKNSRSVRCLLDTGNMLTETITGTPVVIIDEDISKSLLPDLNADEPDRMSKSTSERFRLIPYRTAGGSGLLPAFKPDSFTVNGEQKKVIVAVDNAAFRGKEEFGGILNRNII